MSGVILQAKFAILQGKLEKLSMVPAGITAMERTFRGGSIIAKHVVITM